MNLKWLLSAQNKEGSDNQWRKVIMFHDYTIREHYHVVEEFSEKTNTVDTLAIFKIKNNINLEKVEKLYQEYKYIKD